MSYALNGKTNPAAGTPVRNRNSEMDEWRSSKTLVIRKATPEELARYMEVR